MSHTKQRFLTEEELVAWEAKVDGEIKEWLAARAGDQYSRDIPTEEEPAK